MKIRIRMLSRLIGTIGDKYTSGAGPHYETYKPTITRILYIRAFAWAIYILKHFKAIKSSHEGNPAMLFPACSMLAITSTAREKKKANNATAHSEAPTKILWIQAPQPN